MVTATETFMTSSNTIESSRDPQTSAENARLSALTYINSVPWDTWQSEFFYVKDESGSYRYTTIREFARTRTDVIREQRWICWSVGRCPEAPMHLADEDWANWEPPVPWRGDWLAMRANQGSVVVSDVLANDGDHSRKRTVLQYHAELIARLESVLHELDILFGGQVFNPELSISENDHRGFIYLEHLEKISTLMFSVPERIAGCISTSVVPGDKQSGPATSRRSPVDADDVTGKPNSQSDWYALLLKSFQESSARRDRRNKEACHLKAPNKTFF
jgi:hypothetical protein